MNQEIDIELEKANMRLFAKLMNKILSCKTKDGRRFVCKLVGIKDELLFFETKDGRTIVNNIADIYSAVEYHKKDSAITMNQKVIA